MKKNLIIFVWVLASLGLFVCSTDVSGGSIGIRIASKMRNIGIDPNLIVLLISMIPVVELRGAIPIGVIFFNLNLITVMLLSLVGNMIPIFFVLFLFKYFEKILRKIRIFNKFFDWLFKRTLAKSSSIEKYQELGLMFFVAVPLPATGAWTGSLIAYLLKLSYLKSITYIFLGVLIAGIIVSTITFFKTTGLVIALTILIIFTLFGFIKTYFEKKKNGG